jgi:predicted RNA binding protein YcfA (HicA-like mRNA interferase family)
MGRVRRLTAAEAETILKRYGFELVSQKGSHRKWRHPETGLTVVVPMHKGKTLPVGHSVQLCAAPKSPTMSGKQAKCQQVCLKQANFVALKAPKVLTIQRQQLCNPVPAHIGDDAGVVGALADNLIRSRTTAAIRQRC